MMDNAMMRPTMWSVVWTVEIVVDQVPAIIFTALNASVNYPIGKTFLQMFLMVLIGVNTPTMIGHLVLI